MDGWHGIKPMKNSKKILLKRTKASKHQVKSTVIVTVAAKMTMKKKMIVQVSNP